MTECSFYFSWDDTVCSSPAYLSGRAVSSVREEQLICDNLAEVHYFCKSMNDKTMQGRFSNNIDIIYKSRSIYI